MSSNIKKKPALGRGLSALLENADTDITSSNNGTLSNTVGSVSLLPISSIEANPFNPRTNFEKEALQELSQSIAIHGIIQPLTVRKLGRDKFQLISGERRFRASQMAGLTEVPAYIRVANDQTMLEMALVENIQREDLNAIEVALSYSRLIDECNLTQDQLSQKVAKSRSSITNHLRLLKLPGEIQAAVRDTQLSMAHARTLVSAGDEELQLHIYRQIIDEQLSVRDTEMLVKTGTTSKSLKNTTEETELPKTVAKSTGSLSNNQKKILQNLSDKLETKVFIKNLSSGSGQVVFNFNSEVDLNRIMKILNL